MTGLTPQFSLEKVSNCDSNRLGSVWVQIAFDQALKTFDVLLRDV